MNAPTMFAARAGSRPGRWLAGALTALTAVFALAAAVTAHGPDPVFSSRWNQNQAVTFAWRSGWVPPFGYQTAIKAAAADVSATRASQAATFSYVSGSGNPIGYGTGANCSVSGIACFTSNAPTSFTMWFREQGHPFDWGSLRWCQAYSSPPDGCFDMENIALDEFGHVEILNHHSNFSDGSDYGDAVVQTVSRAKPKSGWNAHALARCDVASLQVQYDMQSWGARYSTCLDLATTLTLSTSPTTVSKGGTTTLTAMLKVAGVSSYLRLALNPVSLRTVILQRRPAGTTTWTTVGAMASGPTSGSYTASVSLQARTEFRALFSKPPD
ncbi:MAG TPA: hypothetical protein VFW02_08250, partial [Candidatus Limnocylindrales bacterium]|nr:hypothetical protein [Candidatus Limnocylindrales bacterium]